MEGRGKKRTPKFSASWLAKYGLRVASQGADGSHDVKSLSCCFCEVFGRTGRVDSDDAARKRKRTTRVMVFTPPWRTEHMRTHMMEQHGAHYTKYSVLGPAEQSAFFTTSALSVPPAPKQAIPAVVVSEAGGVSIADPVVSSAGSPGPSIESELSVHALPTNVETIALESLTAPLMPSEATPVRTDDPEEMAVSVSLPSHSVPSLATSPASCSTASAAVITTTTATATATIATPAEEVERRQVYTSVEAYYSRAQRGLTQRANRVALRLVSEQILASGVPAGVARLLEKIPPLVKGSFSNCGFPASFGIRGLHVLVLGCGSGRDAYVASQLVGVAGSVTAVEYSDELLQIARKHIDSYGAQLGVAYPNVRFVAGYSECLELLGIPERSVDLVFINGTLSISPFKDKVLEQAYRALRLGGELHLCDVFASRRLQEAVRSHELLRGEWLGGALYVQDFKRLCRRVGFGEPRQLRAIFIDTSSSVEIAALVGATRFLGATFRCFKTASADSGPGEEDYGEVATYKGSIAEHPFEYALDAAHVFEKDRPVRVGGTTAAILRESWLGRHFAVAGDRSAHFGPFDERSACGRQSVAGAESL